MSRTVITIESLSKKYRLGSFGTGTFTRDLQSWWAKFRGKDDPNSKIDVRNRTYKDSLMKTKGVDGYIWALRDINLVVEEGEILGIIGKNGAGKSTLLKILSRITAPTTGEVRIKGRVASLLEVGTGFHPELTGRENIFLNGSILGMSKNEIQKKFDDIVDFADLYTFIDTPVKRYSSGMYVRLAFAVAAHLDPDILIVDEVLAVGDAAFQKKCLGKMKNVSHLGKTVLFVSHNMAAVSSLCNKALILDNGKMIKYGDVSDIIYYYTTQQLKSSAEVVFPDNNMPGDHIVRLKSVRFLQNNKVTSVFDINESCEVEIVFIVFKHVENLLTGINVYNHENICLFDTVDWRENVLVPGMYKKSLIIPPRIFAEGVISILVHLVFYEPAVNSVVVPNVLTVEAIDSDHPKAVRGKYKGPWPGVMRIELPWTDAILIS